jgi:hypothetical protein
MPSKAHDTIITRGDEAVKGPIWKDKTIPTDQQPKTKTQETNELPHQ